MKKMLKVYLVLIAFFAFVFTGIAQVTTSGITGKVTDANNEPLPGATVVAVHQPSGSQYGTITNADGRFTLQGLRSGGPYQVEISFVGYNKATYKAVNLSLGENFVLDTKLKESTVDVGEVIVMGAKGPVFNSEKNGSSINVKNEQIAMMPTISRSINDVTKLTPQANGNQIGGGNYRQNYITVDGAQFNNAFGIGTNLPAGGSPISLDALDQISVNITPFDVRQSGFTGASINAVTRSGSNEFTGSAYTLMQDERYKGNKVGDNAPFTKSKSDYQMYGFRLGGPIIKNKLFFFVNYETEKTTVPGPTRLAATAAAPADNKTIARPTETEMNAITNYLKEKYNYETGPYQNYSNETPAGKFLARIDWNINRNHKFNIRYSQAKSKAVNPPSTSNNPVASILTNFSTFYSGTRQDMNAMWFKNSGYFQETNFSSLASELNSNFANGKLANMFRFTYSYQDEPRSTSGSTFPFVDILKDGKPLASFGTELFSYGNLRQVKTTTITDELTMNLGKNRVVFGLQYEHNKTKNGYMRFGTGWYIFKSWDDFTSGANPLVYANTISLLPNYEQPYPSFNFDMYTAYLQDEFAVNSKLKLSGGLRFDLPTYTQPCDANPMVSSLTFGTEKYNTATLPKSRVSVSPRIGFNYDVKGDRSLVVRGGTGIFTARVPNVWIVAQVSDASMLQLVQIYSGSSVPGPFKPEVNAYYPANQPKPGTVISNQFTMISEDFKLPQAWKSSLSFDAKLPGGIKGTLEGVYNYDLRTAFFVNTGLKPGSNLNIAGYSDNRIIYPYTTKTTLGNAYYQTVSSDGKTITTGSAVSSNAVTPIVLKNDKGGHYYSVTAKLEKSFTNGLYTMVAYTHSGAKNLVDGSGDQPGSAWSGNPNVNGSNSRELSYASYVLPDHLIANVSYKIEYLKHMATTLSLFYDGAQQGRFSYVYSSAFVRDGGGSNLIYVPKDPSEITFANKTLSNGTVWSAADQSAAFFSYINQDKYLKTRKGQYAERNGAVMPWRNQFDVKVLQDFYVKVGGKRNTIQVSLDILNVANLINKNWGIADSYYQGNILTPANSSSVVAGGTVKPTFTLNPLSNNDMIKKTFKDNVGYGSTYSMQLGIRYIFN